jgi:heme exporter protein D
VLEFQFDSVSDFLAMGGHGFYVWSSYLCFMVVMAVNVWLPYRQRVQLMRLLKARQSREQANVPQVSAHVAAQHDQQQ